MKKLLMLAIACLTVATITARDYKIISFGQLPPQAQQFITQNFPNAQVNTALREGVLFGSEYGAMLSDGTMIEFNTAGQWKKIVNVQQVSSAAIPAGIVTFVKHKHSGARIVQIEFENDEYEAYEVKLNNRKELVFDQTGQFVREDD